MARGVRVVHNEIGYIRNGYTLSFWCDPYRIQTCNLLIRSQILYSVELMGLIASTKVGIISISAKLFAIFLWKFLFCRIVIVLHGDVAAGCYLKAMVFVSSEVCHRGKVVGELAVVIFS